jgi:hypothetical protein
MKFSQFSKYLQRLESTSKRLEMTAILTEFIEELGTDEVDKGLYLALGYLKAPFESEKFNIADKMMAKILNRAYNKELSEIQTLYSKLGDKKVCLRLPKPLEQAHRKQKLLNFPLSSKS